MQAMAECSGPPQSTRKDVLGTFYPSPEPVDSSTPSSAPLSRRTLLRHSSFVRAVCVNAPVRICTGGDQRWSSLPRQLSSDELCLVVLYAVSVKLRRDENTTELMPSRPERAEGHGCCRRYRVALSTACRTLLCWCTSCPSNRCL